MKENIFRTVWVITKVSFGPNECALCFPYRDFRRQYPEMEHRKLSLRIDEVEAFDEVKIFFFLTVCLTRLRY